MIVYPCDETISHMVTTDRSYFRTARKAYVTAGKIYHGSFQMLSWPHRALNNINICFWLLETCTKCSYFVEENMQPGAQRLALKWSTSISCTGPRTYRAPALCGWASFQATGTRCVKSAWSLYMLYFEGVHSKINCIWTWLFLNLLCPAPL